MAEKEYIERRIVLKPFSRRISKLSGEPIIIAINQVLSHAEEFVKSLPAADVAPVKHGHWIDWGGFGSLNNGFIPEYKCSVCNSILHSKRSYCGNCGARMDGGDGNE